MNYNSGARQWLAVVLSLLLVLCAQSGLYAQGPPPPGGYDQQPPPGNYAPLDAMQLNQLVAPIALYPDALVAQVLTASTFPDQVNDADNWIHQNAGMPPDQMAGAVNGMPWDPSVKALTAFPTVLDNMARNNSWTGALGNAYYNQPADVMNAVQAMRYQAQQAGTLRSTPQERVYDSGGAIVIQPANPAYVYVPYYNPWTVYGTPIPAWGGYYWGPPRGVVLASGLAIGFGVGIGVGLFAHYGWGYHAWHPGWNRGVVIYNHNTYISRSATVVNRGHFGGYNRGVYEHEGRGVPGGYHAVVTGRQAVYAHPGQAGNYHPGPGQTYRPPPTAGQTYRPPAGTYRQGTAQQTYRPPNGGAQTYHPAPTQTYHPAPQQTYHPAPTQTYHPAPQQTYHPAPAQTYHPAPTQTYHPPSQPAHNAPTTRTESSRPPQHAQQKDEHHEK